MAAIRRRLIRLNPEITLERRNKKKQQEMIIGILLWMTTLSETYVAREIRTRTPPMIKEDVGTNAVMQTPTKSHKMPGRIRC